MALKGHENVAFTLAAAVANAGTVTVGYPTGVSKGDFVNSPGKHVLFVNSNKYEAPADFTVTFNANASSITVTNGSGGTWPQSARCRIQFDKMGYDGIDEPLPADRGISMVKGGLYLLRLGSPNVLDRDGICASQNPTGAGNLTINGALASGGSVTLDVPRTLTVYAAGNETSYTFTAYGEDEYGEDMVETMTGPNNSTTYGGKAFKKVTRVAVSGDSGAVEIGTADRLGLPSAIKSVSQVMAEFRNGVRVGGFLGTFREQWNLDVADLSTGSAAAYEGLTPCAATLKGATAIVRVAISTGGDVTMANVTTAVDGLTLTVANSATKGTAVSDTPTAGHATTSFAKGVRYQVIAADAFNGGGALNGFVEFEATNLTFGHLDVAAGAEATATTGDVRGIYRLPEAANGDNSYELLVWLPDPDDKGVAQYSV